MSAPAIDRRVVVNEHVEDLDRRVEQFARAHGVDLDLPESRSLMTVTDEIERIAVGLRAAGHTVTIDGRIESDAAADLIGIAHRTLANWRTAGTGPPWILAGRVWYRIDEVLAWIDAQARR